MVGGQGLLENRDLPEQQRHCDVIAALKDIQAGEIADAGTGVAMFWPQRFFLDRKASLRQRLGLAIAALLDVERDEIAKGLRDARVF